MDDENDDSFDQIYKGEISKSGAAILPSKRIRRIPEKAKLNIASSENNVDEKNLLQEKEKKVESSNTDTNS